MKLVKEENKYQLFESDQLIGFIEYEKENSNTVKITHTYILPNQRGKGYASKIMKYFYGEMNAQNKAIVSRCSYAKKWLDENTK